jgi:hypothetical protein
MRCRLAVNMVIKAGVRVKIEAMPGATFRHVV